MTFLAALDRVGRLQIQQMEPGALFVRFEITADQDEWMETFPDGLSLEEMLEDFGPELISLLQQEGRD